MFDSQYKEALENMKLTDDFKAALVSRMKNVKAVPRTRLVLVSIAAVLVLVTSAGLAANVATNGHLFRSLFGGQDPQTTDVSSVITETTDETTTAPETTTTTEETTTAATTAATTETTAATTSTATVTTKPAETTKATTAATTAPSGRVAPNVRVSVNADSITVSWDKISASDLVGYKVVASIGDSTPQYSENGYFCWITDRNTTSCTMKSGDCYNSGDFSCFTGGQAYYFSVTAIYGEEWTKIAGNAIQATMPGSAAPVDHIAPVVTATAQADGVLVTWNVIDSSDLDGYKVVYSATNPNPSYPDDGYYCWITDRNTTSCLVSYCDVAGGDYYFSVTALYAGHSVKVPGNAVKATMPAKPTDPTTAPTYITPSLLSAVVQADGVMVTWNKIDLPNFNGYKVVHSSTNPNPAYPGDGYDAWIEDRNTTSFLIPLSSFTTGVNYVSVTALYDEHNVKIAATPISVTIP